MSDTTPQAQASASEPTPNGVPEAQHSSEAPAGSSEPQRYDDPTLPQWARGKTFEEIVQLTQTIVDQPQQYGTPQPPPPQPTMQSQQPSPLAPPDPNLIYTNPQEYQRQYEAYTEARISAQLNQYAAPVMQGQQALFARQAEADKRESMRDPRYAEVWQKWAPEVEAELTGIPPENRNRALYDKAAAIVKANHMDEMMQAQIEKVMAQGVGTERTSLGGASAGQPMLDKLDEAWDSDHPYFVKARNEGLSKSQVREWLQKRRQSADEFVDNIQSENIISTLGGFQRRSA